MRLAEKRPRTVAVLIWVGVVLAIAVPLALAAASRFLAYRDAVYIIAGFAGIVCLALFLVQPLLAAGLLPGFNPVSTRRWHRRVGTAIVALVVVHVGGLYLTSPPDTLDALLLVAPTPFSVYGVIAMWGVLLTALLVALRQWSRLGYSAWRLIHNALALVVVTATIVHAVQIQGAMELVSKWALCMLILATTIVALVDVHVMRKR